MKLHYVNVHSLCPHCKENIFITVERCKNRVFVARISKVRVVGTLGLPKLTKKEKTEV